MVNGNGNINGNKGIKQFCCIPCPPCPPTPCPSNSSCPLPPLCCPPCCPPCPPCCTPSQVPCLNVAFMCPPKKTAERKLYILYKMKEVVTQLEDELKAECKPCIIGCPPCCTGPVPCYIVCQPPPPCCPY